MYHGTQKGTAPQSLFSSGAREMQQGSARSIDDKPKDAKILPFQASLDCSLSANHAVTRNHKGFRIMMQRIANHPCHARIAGQKRHLNVGCHPALWNFLHHFIDFIKHVHFSYLSSALRLCLAVIPRRHARFLFKKQIKIVFA